MNRKSAFFYGWYLVAICVISMILIYGIRHSFAVFFSSILEEFSWSRGDTAMMMSLNILTYGLMAPIAGTMADRWRARVLLPVGVILLGIATAGCAFATRLWHFYFLFGFLMSIGSAFSGWPLFGPALMNWFVRKRGLVLGLGQMGGGLSFVYSIFVEFSIRSWGWRYTFLVLSFVLMGILLPLLFCFFFYRPDEKNMFAYGTQEADFPAPRAQSRVGEKTENTLLSLGEGLKDVFKARQLWFLIASYALYWGIAAYMVIAHQVRFLQDEGLSSSFSASIYALLGVMIVLGNCSGFLSDWLGREKCHSFATCLSIIGLGALIGVNDASRGWLVFAFAVLFGYGTGMVSPVTFAASADIFDGRHFGTVAGLVLGGMGVGSVLGPWLGGYLYDAFGTYRVTFVLCMISIVFSNIFLWVAAPRNFQMGMGQTLDT